MTRTLLHRTRTALVALLLPLCVAAACSSPGPYPDAPYGYGHHAVIPDLVFDGLDAAGSPTRIHLHDQYEPSTTTSRLLVLRVGSGWCGTCDWHLRHTAELFAPDIAASLSLLDLVVADDDNMPATLAFLPTYRARTDEAHALGIDPQFQLGAAMTVHGPLPLVVLVDRRTMKIEDVLSNPDPDALKARLYAALDRLNGTSHAASASTDGPDGIHRNEWDLLRAMSLPTVPPPDPTNKKADDPAAAALGRDLFSDKTLSPSSTISCATCHDPTHAFVDGKPQAIGVSVGDRNAASVLLASHARWQFWDGRADSLWSQALGPLENPKESGSSRLFVAHAIFDRYKSAYQAIFGALPSLGETGRFPTSGMPGGASWHAMTADDQRAVSVVFANVGKSIAAFERSLRVSPNALDRYVAGDLGALSDAQKQSLRSFLLIGCQQCHYGPRLTDDAFHVVRFPTGRQDGTADPGRIDGIPSLVASEFVGAGPFSDAPESGRSFVGLAGGPSTAGAFKTPPLRGVADTAPYGHGGSLLTLLDVAKNYGEAGLPDADARAEGVSEPWLAKFTGGHAADFVPFLEVLTAAPVP